MFDIITRNRKKGNNKRIRAALSHAAAIKKAAAAALFVLLCAAPSFAQTSSVCADPDVAVTVFPEAHAMSRATWLVAYNPTLSQKFVSYRSPSFTTNTWRIMTVWGGQRVALDVSSMVWRDTAFVLEVMAEGVVVTLTSWDTRGGYHDPFTVPSFVVCKNPDVYVR